MIAQIRLIARRIRARYVLGFSMMASAIRFGLYVAIPISAPATIALTLGDVIITSLASEHLIRIDNIDQLIAGRATASLG